MAEEADGSGSTPEVDPIKNVKAEFSRKTDAIAQQLAQQNLQMQQFMQTVIAAQQQQPQQKKQEEVAIDPYQDPAGFTQSVIQKATAAASQAAINQTTAATISQQEQNTALAAMLADYPELNDRSSDLYIKAMEYANALPQGQRSTGVGLRAAIRDAAADLGVSSVKHRTKQSEVSDEYTVSSGSGSGTRAAGGSRRGEGRGNKDLPQEMLDFAALLGRPVNDPKYIESLKQHAGRKAWNRYK